MDAKATVTQVDPNSSDFGISGSKIILNEKSGELFTRDVYGQVKQIGSGSLVIQSGTGALARSAQDKARELKSIADFTTSGQFDTVMTTSGTAGYGLLGSLKINGVSASAFAWLHVGDTDASSSTDAAVLVNRNLTGAGNSHGYSDSSTFHKSAGTSYNSVDSRGTVSGSSNYGHVNCYQALWTFSTSGTITLHEGYVFAPVMTAGAITTMVGVDISQPALSGGAAVNTFYGLLIGDVNNASVNNYAIYTSAGTVRFGGLLDISAAAAGQIKFPAAQNASSDANTLDDYEEGTWTPIDSSGAALTFTAADGSYEKIGRQFRAGFRVTYPVTADGSAGVIGGLPFTTSNNNYARQGFRSFTGEATLAQIVPAAGGTTMGLLTTAGAGVTNGTLSADIVFGTALSHI